MIRVAIANKQLRAGLVPVGLAKALLFTLATAIIYTAPVLSDIDGVLAIAQDSDKEDSKAPFKGKKVQTLGKKVYELITEANELADNKDEAGARRLIEKGKAFEDLTPYEIAQLHNFSGFLYYNDGKYPQAKRDYETVLKQPEIPEGLRQQSLRILAQIMYVTEDYQNSIRYAQQYMDEAGEDPDMYSLIGTSYFQLDQLPKIIPPLERAIELAKERGVSTKENWWLLLRAAYWDKKDYRKVREILETLVVNWPKKDYWTQLSAIYYELKDEPKQLAAYEAAHDQGLLERSSELIQMAQLFMQAEVPYKGAKVLEKGLADGIVEKNVRSYRLLSQAWQMAQEDRKAIGPLNEAASLSDDGELYARLAQSYLNLSEYKNCIDASRKALDKGKLKATGNAWLIMGMCQFETKALNSAKASFQSAAKFEKSAKNARNWLKYVDNEQERVRQLQESLDVLRKAQAEAAANS